ncbi:MAG: hypothetical protein ACRD22_15855, partial [Terriglobia bacterium]
MTDEEIQEGSDRVTGILNRANWGIWRFAGQTRFGRGRMRLSDGGTEATDGHIAVRVNAPINQCFGSEHDIVRDQKFDICADLEGAKQIEKEIPLNPSISRFGNTGVQVLEKCVKVGGFTRNGDPRVQSVERLSGSHHNLFLLWGGRLKAIANGEETPGEFRVILDARIMRDFCDYVLRYSGKKSASPIHFQFNGPNSVVIALAELEQSQITAAIMPMREGNRGWRDLAKT